MTIRQPTSTIENTYFDSQQVDAEDLLTEQTHNDQGLAAVINNHIGSGILPGTLAQPILLDTSLVIGFLDGKPIFPQAQPSDSALGVQLEIGLFGSNVFGRRQIKVAIIGLDFAGNLQYDTMFFSKNEKRITAKHYTKILSILFNDALGAAGNSYNLLGTGKIVVREASPFTLSRNVLMAAQDSQPNLFFRDFALDSSYVTFSAMLAAAVPGYSTDNLNISIQYKQLRTLSVNDVVTQYGQKFQATTNNIQKITLLLNVQNNSPGDNNLWTGDLIASIYPLQSTVTCASDITPSLAIEFSPSNIPLAQVSVNLSTLADANVTLDGYSQPVDFVFSNTQVANGTLTAGSFYVVTLRRSGSANTCNIQLAVGTNVVTTTRETIFNGSTWTDVPEEALWFRVFTDAAKVTDGQAYDSGQGIYLPKTTSDPNTGATIDNQITAIEFSGTNKYFATVKAVLSNTDIIQDQRTGAPVAARKQYVPEIDLLTQTNLTALQAVGEPIIIGSIQDNNIKSIVPSTATTNYSLHHFGFYKNEIVIKVDDTNGDGYNNVALVTAILNGDFNNAKIIPDTAFSPSTFYRIAKAEIQTMIFGDLNGDGIVDANDLTIAQTLLGKSLITAPTLANYITSTNPFTADNTATYQIINPLGPTVITSGTCQIIPSTSDVTVASIVASAIDFTSISNLLTYNFVINTSSGSANLGTFSVISIQSPTVLTIQKYYLNTNTMMQILRADINTNYTVDSSDISYISNYVQKLSPYPAPTSPGNLVGQPFRVLHLVVEQYVDRADDYPSTQVDRSATIHAIQDLPSNDNALLNFNYFTTPLVFSVTKKLTWQENLVITSGCPKQVPSAFSSLTSLLNLLPTVMALPFQPGVTIATYPTITAPDSGRNDFYVPNNLIVGNQLINPNGTPYKVDFEIGNVILQIPTKAFAADKIINLLSDVVADYTGTGFTRLGYRAMKFSDNTNVTMNAIIFNQLRFTVALQSLSDGYDGYGDVDCGVYLDVTTGILSLNFLHVAVSALFPNTLTAKVQITVYMKKSGFNNNLITIGASQMQNILNL